MDIKQLEPYVKPIKLLIRVISFFLSGITFFTAMVPGLLKKTYTPLLAETSAFSTVPADTDPSAPRITIADAGASGYVIIYGRDAVFAEKTAAQELSDYLFKISGARLSVYTDERSETANEIVVGKTNREGSGTFTVDRTALGDDGFNIKVAGQKLVIAGGEKRGTLYGVYTFLEDFLGCRWYSKDFEMVPAVSKVTVKLSTDVTQTPAFTFRDIYWDCTQDSVFRAKAKINGIHFDSPVKPMAPYIDVIKSAGFSFEGIINGSDYFAEHPEYFFVDKTGNRNPGQLCLTNPVVIRLLNEYVCAQVAARPDCDIFTLFTNDSDEVCNCPDCAAVNGAEGTCVGTLMRVVNTIAADVYKIRPDATFQTLIWESGLTPPAITKPAPNVAVQLCAISCNMAKPYDQASPKFCEFIKNWSTVGCKISVWDYNINFTNYCAPCPNIDNMDGNIRLMYANNIRGYFMQGNAYGNSGEFGELRAYITAKLLWNPACDIEAIKNEFLRAYYGPGYKNIAAYIKLTEENAADSFDIICDPDKMLTLNSKQAAQCDVWWDAAEAAAQNDGQLARIQRSRIQLRYYKATMHLGEFSYLNSFANIWDEGEKLYDDMQRMGVNYICQGRTLNEKDKVFFVLNPNKWKM